MKTIALLFALAIGGLTFAQKTSTLSGKIRNPKGEKIYLRSYGDNWEVITHDSCTLENGSFKLSVKLDSLTNLHYWDQNETGQVYLKPGENLSLTLNTHFFDETIIFSGDGADRNNMMAQVAIVSETMTHYRNVMFGMHDNDAEMDTLSLFNAIATNDSSFNAYIDYEIKSFPEMKTYLESAKKSNENISASYIRKAYKHMIFADMLKKESGAQFLDAKGVDLDGKEVKVSDYYGKLTVLDFWATWCGPCKAEFPGLHELEEKYEGKVTFLGVASFCKKDDWEKMAKEEGFHNSIYISKEDMEPVSKKYAIQTIPRYIILDEKGKILNLEALRPSMGLEDQLIELLK